MRWPISPLSYVQCKAFHLNGVQTELKCKPNVKRCKRFVFVGHSPLLHHNTLKTKAITLFQADHILTRFVFPPLNTCADDHHDLLFHVLFLVVWAKHPAPYPPCGGRFPSTRPQTVLTCLHVYGFPLVTLLFTIVLNHRVAVLTDNQCLAMSFEHQFLPLIIAFQLGESPHMMHDYFSFLTT